ncbi:MAG TPA: ankyrin repeat domain-containing protein, partial [Gammaproteobacteria bacterium]|nr:ankyrin repeat domain-containing protein [Gammaproteobacteria bacterium]
MPKNNQIPEKYSCSITGQIMIDPVIAVDGYTYEREAIEQWLQMHDTSPRTNERLDHKQLTANHDKHSDILEFLDSQPELYEGEEIYFPKSWIAQCVMAIKQNKIQVVQRWLDKDKRLLIAKLEGNSTALQLACEFGSPELVDILLKTLKQKNQSIQPGVIGLKPIHLNVLLERALNSSDYAQCELLLRLGAEVEQPEASSQNVLLHQMVISDNPEAISWLLQPDTSSQNTLLHRMVIHDNSKAVSWLLEQKAVLESRNCEGNTPLLLAAIYNRTKLAEFLLKNGANPHVKNAKQQSCTLIALLNQSEPMLRLLIGAKKAAFPPLHLALELNDNEILEVLLRQKIGAIEAQDERRRTPFYHAVERGSVEAARLFL